MAGNLLLAASPMNESSVLRGTERAFDHRVQFYNGDESLYGVVASFFVGGHAAGEPLAVFATPVHRQGLCAHLSAHGFDVEELCASGALALFDARDTLCAVLVDGVLDPHLFKMHVGAVLDGLATASRGGRVRAYGEMVDLLWADGNPCATFALEALWNEFGQGGALSLLCSYCMANFSHNEHERSFHEICAAHGEGSVAEACGSTAEDARARPREVGALQERARALTGEVEHRKRMEQALCEALLARGRAEQSLRTSQQELLDFFENAAEGLHSAGPDGVILSANRAELEMLGYTREEYVGHNVAEFHVEAKVVADVFARLRRNETVKDWSARLFCKDGSIKHVLIDANAYFREGTFVHTRCFTRDVSDRMRLEDELRRHNGELMRTVRFSEMFVGILGHDLRNPLSAIATAGSLLRRRAESDKVAKPAARIVNSAERMARMIDQLLDFTRIRLGSGIPIEPQPVDLLGICRLAIEELEAVAGPDQPILEAVGDAVGMWDADRLHQLVSNLVSNALVHGDASGPVVIHVNGTCPETMILEVRNPGVVPAAVLPILFEPFRSGVNEKQERSNGLGLGLFISQQIVLGHRGSIDVESSEVVGTRICVKLPRRLPHGGAVSSLAGAAS
jgi:PAS domain S-box-containing protein